MRTLYATALLVSLLPLTASAHGRGRDRGPSRCDTDDLLEDYLALFNDRATDWTDVIDPAYEVESPYGNMDLAGWQGLTQGAWYAMPDVQWQTVRVVAAGDRVALEYTFEGTFDNDFLGYTAQGQSVSGRGMEMHEIDPCTCRILRTWNYSDAFGFFSQLQ